MSENVRNIWFSFLVPIPKKQPLHFRPLYLTSHLLSSPFYFSPSRNSDPGSRSRLFSPLPTTVRALHFYREPFLPSSSRAELRLPYNLSALSYRCVKVTYVYPPGDPDRRGATSTYELDRLARVAVGERMGVRLGLRKAFWTFAHTTDTRSAPVSLNRSLLPVIVFIFASPLKYSAFFRIITGEHSNQDQIWGVNIRGYMVFGSIVDSDYYDMALRNTYHSIPKY